MANFKTHLVIGAIASSGLAALSLGIPGVEPKHAIAFGLAGTLGGILPDIDSDNSFAINLVFTIFAIALSVFFVYWYYSALPIHYVFGLGIGAFLAVRFVARYIFERLTVHRGIFHSLLAAVMVGMSITSIAYYGLDMIELHAWLIGVYVCFGYIVHLALDEIYSVDLSNVKIKRSFGSALKVISLDNPVSTVIAVAATGTLIWYAPNSKPFTTTVFNSQTYDQLVKLFTG